MNQKIKCPSCSTLISIDDVLSHQIEEKMKAEYSKKSDELEKQKEEIKAKENNINSIVSERVLEQINAEKIRIYKEAKASIEKEQDLKIALLEDQLKSKEEKLEKATLTEIELRKEKIKLDSDKKEFELEKMRQLDADRAVIVEESRQKVTEEYQYKIAQLNKQLQDSIKVKDELARKLEQGSQQAQGEILEVALEELLKAEFTNDEICPVPKCPPNKCILQTQ